jgi:hypothetical protein
MIPKLSQVIIPLSGKLNFLLEAAEVLKLRNFEDTA